MRTISCLIIEDEPHAMQLLEDHIAKVPYLQLKGKCYDAFEALDFLNRQKIDVIFLDINMPQLSGLEMAAMSDKTQKIIFTTAYSEYALDSFDYQVIDYLLKPISFKRFMIAVKKLSDLIKPVEGNIACMELSPAQTYLFVKSGKQIHRIEYASIYYFEALKEYIAIHTGQEKLLVYKRMKDVAEILPAQFVRVHNSYIIHIDKIQRLEPGMVQVNDQQLPVSNSYKELLLQKVNRHLL